MVHFYSIDNARARQCLRNMLFLHHFTAIELLRFVQIDWLRLNFQVNHKMMLGLRPIMLIGNFHPINLLLCLFSAHYIDHALVLVGHKRNCQKNEGLYC